MVDSWSSRRAVATSWRTLVRHSDSRPKRTSLRLLVNIRMMAESSPAKLDQMESPKRSITRETEAAAVGAAGAGGGFRAVESEFAVMEPAAGVAAEPVAVAAVVTDSVWSAEPMARMVPRMPLSG